MKLIVFVFLLGSIHILSDDLLWSVSSYGELLWSIELSSKCVEFWTFVFQQVSFFRLLSNRSTLKNEFLLALAQHVVVGSIDSNLNQLQLTFYSKRNGQQTFTASTSWSSSFDQCSTLNNLIVCSKNDDLIVFTIPTSATDGNVASQTMKMSNKIDEVRILIENVARSVITVKMSDGQTKLFHLTKTDSTGSEWNFNELNVLGKSKTSFSVTTEKNSGNLLIIEGFSTEQKLHFQVSTLNDQTLRKTRSWIVELPENMGQIEYLSYSIVRQNQLATVRMQDGSLLVIKLAENGGKTMKDFSEIQWHWMRITEKRCISFLSSRFCSTIRTNVTNISFLFFTLFSRFDFTSRWSFVIDYLRWNVWSRVIRRSNAYRRRIRWNWNVQHVF